ncbi:MAG: phytoene/squalene synthase family protein [Halofilum sp. (in: g-proteobacteria)]
MNSTLHTPANLTATAVMRHHGQSFHWAGRLLPAEVRLRCARLYAICRAVDDLADLPVGIDERRVSTTRLEGLIKAIRRRDATDPLVAEAARLFEPDARAWHALEHLAITSRDDIGPVRIANECELYAYADGVAGTVGEMMAEVLNAHRHAEARAAARELGIAMQYTNIARDVLEDAESDRLYLPTEWLGPDVTPTAITGGEARARTAAWHAVLNLLDRAEDAYTRAWRGLPCLPPSARLGIAVAAHVYRRIGVRIRARGPERYWQRRCRVGTAGKLLATARGIGLFLRTSSVHTPGTVPGTRRPMPHAGKNGQQ